MTGLQLFFLLLVFVAVKGNAQERKLAAINRAAVAIVKPSEVFYGQDGSAISPELIAAFNQFKDEATIHTEDYIPTNIGATSDPRTVLARVADRSVSTFLKTPAVQASAIMRTSEKVEKNMATKVEVVTESGVQHKLNFNLQAFEGAAKLAYEGIVRATIKYQVLSESLAVEVAEKAFGNKDLVITHNANPSDRLSSLSLRWTY